VKKVTLRKVKKLVSNGCDVNQPPKGCDGLTGLHISIYTGNAEIMEFNIERL
jgi:hypothetical protein